MDPDPVAAAQSLVDKHVVKMVLETCQLLSTAHRIIDGTEVIEKRYVNGSLPTRFRNVKIWKLSDDREGKLYAATHVNHPSAIWCRISNNNYNWLYAHFCGLMEEYTYRYGKVHKCSALTPWLQNPPLNIPVGNFTPPTPAMDDKYKVSADSLTNYRNYYKLGKKDLHTWSKRVTPMWLE